MENQQEAPASTNSNPAPTPKKGMNAGIIILIVILVLVALGIGGCFIAKNYVTKKIGDVSTGNLKIGDTTVNVDENQTWPSDLASSVPKFSGGKIQGTSKTGNTWIVVIENATEADYTSYKKALENAGWTADGEELNFAEIKTYSAKNAQDYQISVSYTPQDKAILITATMEKPQTSQ